MRARRLGKVFDPTGVTSSMGRAEFAQSPQALQFQDFVRIYFSTRTLDTNGKFLSHVSYVDMTHNFDQVVSIAQHEVIPLGKLGCFDEHGIFPFSITRHENTVYAYTTGWSRRTAVSVETAIGLVVSEDEGKTFSRLGDGPILSASMSEPFLVGDGFVRVFDDKFHMWYIYGTEWKRFTKDSAPDRIYKIGRAISEDGRTWQKQNSSQLIPDVIGPYESQALPSVARYRDTYHMVFCYRESFDFREKVGRGYRLGYARSKDLVEWERCDNELTLDIPAGEWDSQMQAYPHIFVLGDRLFLLYNGNQFGRYGFGVAELFL